MPNEGEVLTNLEFDYTYAGKVVKLKKANLKQVMDWQRKVAEIVASKDFAADLMITAYALFLSLHEADANITEEEILKNTPGDISMEDTLLLLGFMSQKKVAFATAIKNSLANQSPQPSGGPSSQ